jgi:chitinase
MNFVLAGILILAFIENSVSIQSKVLQLPDPIRGCYFTNWSQYRLGIWKFAPENIESDLCTHIFYAFVSMGEDFKIKSIDANDQDHNGTIGLYNRIDSIKKNQSDLKILLSFGGYEFARLNGPLMHKLMQNADNRKTFIDSAIDFVRLHKFDGFDFNWIPDTETKSDFVIFFQEFRQSIDAESDLNRQSPLLLTLGVPPGIDRIEAGYDGKALAESVDWMNVMTFDYHGQWENKTGFNSPLFDRDGDRLSINSTMMYLTENQEIPKDKLVIGFATYGRGWTLPSTSEPNSIPSPTVGLSPAQPFLRIARIYF